MTYSAKKIAAFLLALAMMVNLLPAGALAEEYNKNSDPIELNFTKGGGAKNSSTVALTEIATVAIVATVSSGDSITSGNIERDEKIDVDISFTITDTETAVAKTSWTYDLSGLCGDGKIFSRLVNNPSGSLLDEQKNPAGTYTVDSTGLVTLIPDPDWLRAHQNGMAGSFNFQAELNGTTNQSLDQNTFRFPGGSDTTVTFLHKTLEADKSVYRLDSDETPLATAVTFHNAESEDTQDQAGAGSVQVVNSGDGSYRLYYKIRVKANKKPNGTLKVSDSLAGGQTLLRSTFSVSVGADEIPLSSGDDQFLTVYNGDTGFELDLKSALAAKYSDPDDYLNKDVWIEYFTYLSEEELDKIQTNTATVTYDGTTLTPSTTVTPTYEKTVNPVKKVSNEMVMNHMSWPDGTMPVSEEGKVYFQTAATLSFPATALSVQDAPTGVVIKKESLRIAIGSNGNWQGYVWYKDVEDSRACTFTETSEDGIATAFNLDVYQLFKWLVEEKSETTNYRELYESYYYDDSSTGTFTLKAGTSFRVTYTTLAQDGYKPGDEDQQPVSNTATWNAYNKTEPATVSVGLTTDPGSTSIAKNAYRANGDALTEDTKCQVDAGQTVQYKLKVAKKAADGTHMNLAGYSVVDKIDNFIAAVPNPIEVYNSIGTRIASYNTETKQWTYPGGTDLGLTIQVVNDGSEGGWSFPVGIKEYVDKYGGTAIHAMMTPYNLFKLTFPQDGTFKDEYTIQYTVQTDTEMPADDGLYGLHAAHNKGGVGIGTPEPTVDFQVNIWSPFPSAAKKFVEWDVANNQAVWEVDVTLPNELKGIGVKRPVQVIEKGDAIKTWIVTDSGSYEYRTLSADKLHFEAYYLEDGTRLDPAGSETAAQRDQYVIKEQAGSGTSWRSTLVFPKGISQDVKVIVRMDLPAGDRLSELTEYHADNTATVEVDGPSYSPHATANYYDNEFKFNKTGKYQGVQDGQPVFRWDARINPEGKKIANTVRPVFKDTLPDGLSLKDTINIYGYLGKQPAAFVLRITPSDTHNIELDILALINQYWDSSDKTIMERWDTAYPFTKPTELSGWFFQIVYYTTIDQNVVDDINAAIEAHQLTDFGFTNSAELDDRDGKIPAKYASDTVEYKYEDLVDKKDVSVEDGGGSIQTLSYSVDINKEAKKINSGDKVLLTDVIPDIMTLQLSTVKVKKADGTDITGDASLCSVSYVESNRHLEIYVPDEMHVIVTFSAIPTGGNVAYVNTVTLSGTDFSQTDTEEIKHTVRAAGTLTGMSNAVQIKKIDRFSVTTVLPGAEFEFFECVTGDNGEIISETGCGTFTSNDKGIVTFSPVKSGTLYCFRETKAPSGYIIGNSVPTYFAAYQVLNSSNRVTVPWNKLSAATRQKIQEKFQNYILVQSLTDSSTTPVYIRANGPATGQNEECWLGSTDYPSARTGYSSLLQEVNAVNLAEAQTLVNRFNGFYDGKKTASAIETGYTWPVENIREDVTTIRLQTSKTLTGRAMEAEEFTFRLYNDTVADAPYLIQSASNPEGAEGETKTITFDDYPIVAAGTYQFRIVEIPGSAENTTYDPAVYRITVSAGYDSTEGSATYGKLVAAITKITRTVGDTTTELAASSLNDPVPFENTYTQPSGTLKLTGKKTLTGRNMTKGEFSFTVKEGDTVVATGSNAKADDGRPGAIIFSTIKYTEAGDHTYIVTEDTPDQLFVSQTGTTSYTVKVSVVQDGENLTAGVISVNNDADGTIDFTNEYNAPTIDLTGTKVWSDGAARDNKSLIKLDLYRYTGSNTPEPYALVQPEWTGNTYTFKDLPAEDDSGAEYTYYAVETILDEEIKELFTVSYTNTAEGHTAENDRAYNGGTITNTCENVKVSVSATKVWDDDENRDGIRPGTVTFTLYADGSPVDKSEITLDGATDDGEAAFRETAPWTAAWSGLDEKKNGKDIAYTVKETSSAEGYTADYENALTYAADGGTITNRHTPGKVSFTAAKTWVDGDNAYNTRPEDLTLTLMKQAEGETEAAAVENAPDPTVTKNGDNTWTYTWEDLPEKENGKTITYSAVEETVPAGYTLSHETENAVTNTWKTGEKAVHARAGVYKEDSARNQLKGAEFTLYKAAACEEGDRIRSYSGEMFTIDTEDKDLEQYLPADESKPVTLYLKETKAPDGYALDGTAYSVAITAEASDPEYDEDEDAFITTKTYAVKINGKESVNIPNAKTHVEISKVDIANGEELEGATIRIIDSKGNVVDEWVSEKDKTHVIEGLKTGEEYTLSETVAPDGYTVTTDTGFVLKEDGTIDDSKTTTAISEEGVLLVEDARIPLVSLAVKKVWDDDDDRDALRPDSISVKLLRNGEAYSTVTLSARNNWTALARDLPATDSEGGKYAYEWEEAGTVEGYTGSKKTEGALTVFTNTHGPEETAVKVKKVWNDSENAAGKRPESVTVQLYADGKAAGEPVTLNADNSWSAGWDHLAKNTAADGQAKPIVYTVAETEVPAGYTSKITGSMAAGYVITNTMETGSLAIEKQFDIPVPEEEPEEEEMTTDIEVVKIWDDNDNKDGNRPASITVRLYAGGTEVKKAELTAAGGWRKTFGGLPKFVDGHPIHYSVTEDPVEWYVPEIRGFTVTNRYMPEVTSLTVKKVWNDDNNSRGIRPASVAMKLNNGTIVMLSEENGWTETVTELPARVNGKPAEYFWTEQSSLGYVQESVETEGSVTVFTNKLWTGPEGPSAGKKPKTYGKTLYHMEDYDTPLGVNVIINHVGDCFD